MSIQITGETTFNLPDELEHEIGRVITRFAALEFRLSNLLYVLLNVTLEAGRLAVREPPLPQRLDLARDLLATRALAFSKDLSPMRSLIEEVTAQRDRLAHGAWIRDPETGRLLLQRLTGDWQPVKGMRGKMSRKVMPEGIPFDEAACRELRVKLERAIKWVDDFGRAVDVALAPLRKTPPPPPPKTNPR